MSCKQNHHVCIHHSAGIVLSSLATRPVGPISAANVSVIAPSKAVIMTPTVYYRPPLCRLCAWYWVHTARGQVFITAHGAAFLAVNVSRVWARTLSNGGRCQGDDQWGKRARHPVRYGKRTLDGGDLSKYFYPKYLLAFYNFCDLLRWNRCELWRHYAVRNAAGALYCIRNIPKTNFGTNK